MYYYGQIVRLRPPEREDLSTFVEWLRNPQLRRYITMRYISHALEERWFESMLDRTGGPTPTKLHFVIETLDAEGKAIGVIALENIQWMDRAAEVGIVVGDTDFWGKGYGSDAMHTLLDVAFRWYNLHRIFLRVVSDNERAIRSYTKCGFQQEGIQRDSTFVDGQYKDLIIMSILEDEFKVGG